MLLDASNSGIHQGKEHVSFKQLLGCQNIVLMLWLVLELSIRFACSQDRKSHWQSHLFCYGSGICLCGRKNFNSKLMEKSSPPHVFIHWFLLVGFEAACWCYLPHIGCSAEIPMALSLVKGLGLHWWFHCHPFPLCDLPMTAVHHLCQRTGTAKHLHFQCYTHSVSWRGPWGSSVAHDVWKCPTSVETSWIYCSAVVVLQRSSQTPLLILQHQQ